MSLWRMTQTSPVKVHDEATTNEQEEERRLPGLKMVYWTLLDYHCLDQLRADSEVWMVYGTVVVGEGLYLVCRAMRTSACMGVRRCSR